MLAPSKMIDTLQDKASIRYSSSWSGLGNILKGVVDIVQ